MAGTTQALSGEQQDVWDCIVEQGRNCFITGCGGTGKSTLISKVVRSLRDKYGSDSAVALTASTGRAAFNIGGCTLHKFAGVGLAVEAPDVLARKVMYNNASLTRWKHTKTLVVDEVSMVSGDLFDKLEEVARLVLRMQDAFAGIQLVLVGDLLQLPPVGIADRAVRVFQAASWKRCNLVHKSLNTVYRQSDMEFVRALTCMRVGSTNNIVADFMSKVQRPITYDDGIDPVVLYARRDRAGAYNQHRLMGIDAPSYTFESVDSGRSKAALEQCPALQTLELRVGCQVMLIRNLTGRLVNGSLGTVSSFMQPQAVPLPQGTHRSGVIPIVEFKLADGRRFTRPMSTEKWETVLPNGQVECSRIQIPLILAWAVTIHKSQGHTIDRLRVDLDGVFEFGQAYTALSRATKMSTLEVCNYSPGHIKADPEAVKYCVENNLL